MCRRSNLLGPIAKGDDINSNSGGGGGDGGLEEERGGERGGAFLE